MVTDGCESSQPCGIQLVGKLNGNHLITKYLVSLVVISGITDGIPGAARQNMNAGFSGACNFVLPLYILCAALK